MTDTDAIKNVLTAFAQYGFRKTSMEDLARASGLSRQTLYKRFGSKEAVRDWALGSFCEDMLERSLAELTEDHSDPKRKIANVFDRWAGDQVELVTHAPHGAELLEMAAEMFGNADQDPAALLEGGLASFFVEQGLSEDAQKASDAAYTLIVASKGLLLKARTPVEYQQGTMRFLSALF